MGHAMGVQRLAFPADVMSSEGPSNGIVVAHTRIDGALLESQWPGVLSRDTAAPYHHLGLSTATVTRGTAATSVRLTVKRG